MQRMAESLVDVFKILGGMVLVVAFSGLMLLISFSISPISTVFDEKTSWFFRCFLY